MEAAEWDCLNQRQWEKHKNNCEEKRSVSRVPGNVRLGTAKLAWEHTEKQRSAGSPGAPRQTRYCVFTRRIEQGGVISVLRVGWFE